MGPDYKTMATDLLDSGMGDDGRLRFILECIEKNKPLYKTDIRFLESMTSQLEGRIRRLQEGNRPSSGSAMDLPGYSGPHGVKRPAPKPGPGPVADKAAQDTSAARPRPQHTKTLISDEQLDEIINRQKPSAPKPVRLSRKKKSFLARLFSRDGRN